MTVADLLEQVRYQINDTDKVEYTDNELINYVNEALAWLSTELIKLGTPILLRKTTLTLSNGEADLPEDFVREQAVLGGPLVLESVPPFIEPDKTQYTIYDGKIYSDNDEITLYYYTAFPSIASPADDLPCPFYFANLLRQIVIFLALNRNEYNTSVEQALMQNFGEQVFTIAKYIGGTNYEPLLPWKV